jgi:putative transposase
VNWELARQGLPVVNRKRVHRIMQQAALLLERHTGRREGRIHDGKVMVMRSNLRWCSDGLEFTCWNGDIIRLAFIIDAFDREIIAWTAVCGAGISGSDVRDMMLEAIEKRFTAMRAPHPIEHLSDNGSPYTAKETRDFATALNLVPCFTPMKSPESNGMSEAFVKTFKRDYIRVNPLPDATTVLRRIAGWIDDYNEIPSPFSAQDALPKGVHPSSNPVARMSGETGATPLRDFRTPDGTRNPSACQPSQRSRQGTKSGLRWWRGSK